MQNFFFDRITDIIIVSASLVLEPLYLFHAVTKRDSAKRGVCAPTGAQFEWMKLAWEWACNSAHNSSSLVFAGRQLTDWRGSLGRCECSATQTSILNPAMQQPPLHPSPPMCAPSGQLALSLLDPARRQAMTSECMDRNAHTHFDVCGRKPATYPRKKWVDNTHAGGIQFRNQCCNCRHGFLTVDGCLHANTTNMACWEHALLSQQKDW